MTRGNNLCRTKEKQNVENENIRKDLYYFFVVLPEVRPGNLRALDRNFSPTGEKQSTTCRFALTRSRNQAIAFSGVGGIRGHSRFMMGRSSVTTSACSSRLNRLDTRPEASTLLMYSRKPSS